LFTNLVFLHTDANENYLLTPITVVGGQVEVLSGSTDYGNMLKRQVEGLEFTEPIFRKAKRK
jgi:hypothetical protein